MIKQLIVSIFLLMPLMARSQDDISVGIAYDLDQLGQNDQEIIKTVADKYFDKLIKKDISGFWELCHSKFKQNTPFFSFEEVGKIIADMMPIADSIVFMDAKKVVYSIAPKTSQFATGGSLDKTKPNYLQFYTIPGIENQLLVLYRIDRRPLSKMITMKFGLEDSVYRLLSLEINTSSINEKNANYYMEVAGKWNEIENNFPKFIALKMAHRLSYLGQGTLTNNMIDLTGALQKMVQDR